MNIRRKTSLKCGGCVDAIRQEMDQLLGAGVWQADVSGVDKWLEFPAEKEAEVRAILEKHGYRLKED